MAAPVPVHLSELVACLALATDLGMGQPLEHALRTCVLSVGVGRQLGLTRDELADAYYIALLRFAGCNSHAHQDALETGDEIVFRSGVAPVLNGSTAQMLRFLVTEMARDLPAPTRARLVAATLAAGPKGGREAIAATCEVARMIAARLGLGPGVLDGLDHTFERYDGKGNPRGVAADAIPVAAHVVAVARDFEVFYRLGGRELVQEVAAQRRGRAYDPRVVDGFLAGAWELLGDGEPAPGWDSVIGADPRPEALTGSRLEDALDCLADFADIRSPYTHGYSRAVADVACRAGAELGLDQEQIEALGAAARLQELGMTSVPMAVLAKKGPLTEGEWERVRLHTYLTERILSRPRALAPIGALAACHHERVDGSGYHRGAAGADLNPAARVLAVSGAYVAMTSQRPWRPALSPQGASATLQEMSALGVLDPPAVDAVLGAAGQQVSPRRRSWPAGLTDREVQVLDLISRGRSNRQVAEELVISVKTVGRHVENIYLKAGVSTRAGAAVFALQHGLTKGAQPV